jgi:predicted ATPase
VPPIADHRTSFGEQLRCWRLRAGFTQELLAERAGLATVAVAALERGLRRSPYPHTVAALAEALGLSAEERGLLVDVLAKAAGRGRPRVVAEERKSQQPRVLVPLTPLIGREAELATVRALLHPADSAVRLLTLVGPGGVGKTALARQVASDLRGGFAASWLVELAPVTDPARVAESVARALAVPDNSRLSRLDALCASLEGNDVLLVLDNCEHVLEACTELTNRLLGKCPSLRVLATSREPLQLPGERTLRLAPLAAPTPDAALSVDEMAAFPAVKLFVERLRDFDPGFVVTTRNMAAVAQVCARLEGIPLALGLAAARLQVLSPDQLVARLDQAYLVLGAVARGLPARQQTLRASLDWSYDLLTEPERAVFRRLAVFVGGCELDAAEAVCQGEGLAAADVLDIIAQLVTKSLVLVVNEGASARYRLPEPVRQYAEYRLVESGEAQLSADLYATWCRALTPCGRVQSP